MTIHIIDICGKPIDRSSIIVNCGERLIFNPIKADWEDGRICEECLRVHRLKPFNPLRNTFAVSKQKGG